MIPPQLPRVPFVAFSGMLCGGILLVMRVGSPLWAGVALLCLGGVSWVVLHLFGTRLSYRYREVWWLPILLCFLGLGMCVAWPQRPLQAGDLPDSYIARGIVIESRYTPYGTRAEVVIDELAPRGGGDALHPRRPVVLTCDSVVLLPGHRVAFAARFSPVEGAASYRSWLRGRGIDMQARPVGGHVVVTGRVTTLKSVSRTLQMRAATLIDRSALNAPTRGFLRALLLGDRTALDADVRSSFADAGVAHVLAVSGLHVGILLALLLPLLQPLALVGARLKAAVTVLVLWLYVLLTGMQPPVVRAAVMASCMLAAWASERAYSGVNALAVSAFFILFFDPRALLDAGFLLSFIITAGIIVLVPKFSPRFEHGKRHWGKLLSPIVVALTAMLLSWVLSAHIFHRVPLLFLPVNLLFTLLLPLYFAAAGVHELLLGMGTDWPLLAALLEHGYSFMEWSAGKVSGVDGAAREVWVSEWLVWLYLGALTFFALWLHAGSRVNWWTGAALMTAAIVVAAFGPSARPVDTLDVDFSGASPRVIVCSGASYSARYMPRRTLSGVVAGGRQVVFLDAELPEPPEVRQPRHCDMLVLGKSYNQPIERALSYFAPDSLLLEPGLDESRLSMAGVRGECLPVNR